MTFRKAEQKDLLAVIGMIADDALAKERENFQDPLPDSYLVAFDKICEDPNQELIVIEDEHGDVIGTLQLSFTQYLTYQGGVRAQVEGVRIRKDKRGLGIGKKMLIWSIARAKERKAHVLQLTTDKKRPEAIAFYKNLGFTNSHEGLKLHF